jgi:hypothetical protein
MQYSNKLHLVVGKCEGRDHLKNLGEDGSIVLKWIFKKWNRRAWT